MNPEIFSVSRETVPEDREKALRENSELLRRHLYGLTGKSRREARRRLSEAKRVLRRYDTADLNGIASRGRRAELLNRRLEELVREAMGIERP
jgi:hypothetical protein